MPIAWDELSGRLRPAAFTIPAVQARLARLRRDPWADYWTCRQRITTAMMQAIARTA